jgi:hypothetical protein
MKGIKCLFCDDYGTTKDIDKDWFLCLSCGIDYELKDNKISEIWLGVRNG